MRVKISVHVPLENADEIRKVIGNTGAGVVGEYSFCSFTTTGVGRSKPSNTANPYIGTAGHIEEIQEENIEVICDRSIAKLVIENIKKAHPYEEPAIEIVQIVEESEL